MEIQNPKPVGEPAQTAAARDASRDAVRRGLERLDRAQEAQRRAFEKQVDTLARAKMDRVDLSERARLFADDPGVDGDPASREARERRLAELRRHVQQGTLYTPERTEEAARRLLDS